MSALLSMKQQQAVPRGFLFRSKTTRALVGHHVGDARIAMKRLGFHGDTLRVCSVRSAVFSLAALCRVDCKTENLVIVRHFGINVEPC